MEGSGGFIGIGRLKSLEELEGAELKELSLRGTASKLNSGGFIGIGSKKALAELEAAEEK